MFAKINEVKDTKLNVVRAVCLATAWIMASEFIRNQFLLISHWKDHYQNLGLVFPAEPINGFVWLVWSAGLAVMVWVIGQKFGNRQTVALVWTMTFMMMWLVIGNLLVLPVSILLIAVPLSLIEVWVADTIVRRFG